MNEKTKLQKLRQLQSEVDLLRDELGFSKPGELTFESEIGITDYSVVVEADGFGAAVTRVVKGNYPIDYNTIEERAFDSETDAEQAAEYIAEHGVVRHVFDVYDSEITRSH